MELTGPMQAVFMRCKRMNCVSEGQGISIGCFIEELSGRDNAIELMDEMIAANLFSQGVASTYVLTRTGAEALSSTVARQTNVPRSAFRQQSRVPVNKL